MSGYNRNLTAIARTLRKNMTKEERKLWYEFLRDLPIMVHRQKVIGNYIVDFYIAEAKLVIELDGSQHYEAEGLQKDAMRDDYMKSMGLRVLRYANCDVMNSFDAVCEDILNHIRNHTAR